MTLSDLQDTHTQAYTSIAYLFNAIYFTFLSNRPSRTADNNQHTAATTVPNHNTNTNPKR